MIEFKDMEEVEEWLKPLTYEQYWQEIDPNGLLADDREHCDREIARGISQDTVLVCLKADKRLEIIQAHNLPPRDLTPNYSLH